ncbi:MAG TPA: hypothetical protein PLT55_04760 [Acidimicrobiia bacterium]|nr:hypothetical protein [Acidimicrobiia bacterium]
MQSVIMTAFSPKSIGPKNLLRIYLASIMLIGPVLVVVTGSIFYLLIVVLLVPFIYIPMKLLVMVVERLDVIIEQKSN